MPSVSLAAGSSCPLLLGCSQAASFDTVFDLLVNCRILSLVCEVQCFSFIVFFSCSFEMVSVHKNCPINEIYPEYVAVVDDRYHHLNTS